MKLKVYDWRNDEYYFLEGEIIERTFNSSWEEEKDYTLPDGTSSRRKCIKEFYIIKFKTTANKIIVLENFKSLWKNGKEFENSFRETL